MSNAAKTLYGETLENERYGADIANQEENGCSNTAAGGCVAVSEQENEMT
jgi:hypothetical protein